MVTEETPVLKNGSRWRWITLIGCLIIVSTIIALGLFYYFRCAEIPSSGGLYFNMSLPVPKFAQNDPRWANDALGPTDSTVGAEGCAVSSAAMVLAFYGEKVDPGVLNAFLSSQNGYTPEGWLYWEKAAEFPPSVARHAYEDRPSFYLIDSNLLQGNPVIVRLRLPSGITHFVVISGKAGFRYLIADPASIRSDHVYPLDLLSDRIEALRFYRLRS
ncbi:MAG: C39 family peptidase [Verrucomicrobia bacterium]|nr:C39 family peptidase [Verrucomicrobiota bacterium]